MFLFLFESLVIGVDAEEHIVASASLVAASARSSREVGESSGVGESFGDVLGGIDASNFDEAFSRFFESFGDEDGSFGFSFCTNDRRTFFLLCLEHDVRLPLCFLLGDLLLLDGVGELLAEDEVSDRDVVEDDVESLGSLRQSVANLFPAGGGK